ncbi:MAG: efflux RND transporter permease subunit [Myxococcota bacterium]
MIDNLIKKAISLKYLLLILTLMFSILSLFLIKNLSIQGDILEYLPLNDEDVSFFKEVGNKYLSNYFIMVSIESDRDFGVFSRDYIKKIDELTRAYKDIEGVSSVISLTNVMDIKKIEDGIDVSNLIDSDRISELTDEEIESLKGYVLKNERYVNQIVSKNGRYSQIIIRPIADVNRETIVNKVEELSKNILGSGNLKFYAGGWPVAIRDTNNATMKDLKRLTPLVIVISMLVLFLGFRTIRGVLLPILVVILANLFTFAIMALLKKPVTIGTSAIPVILVSTGTAYAIHFINQYYFYSAKESKKLDIIIYAIKDKWKAVLLSALTTMAGFVTLVTATLTTVVDLGIFMTLGIFFAFALAILVVPAILSILSIKKAEKVQSEEEALSSHRGIFLPYVEGLVLSHSKKIILIFLIISILLLPSLMKITADVNPINYFKKDAPIRKSEQLLVEHFGGAVPVYILVKGEVKDPRVMYITEYVERKIGAVEKVSNAQSVGAIVADMNYNLIGDYNIPLSSGKIGNLWFFVEGNDYLNQFVTRDMDESVILARIESLQKSYVTTANNEIKRVLLSMPKRFKIIRGEELKDEKMRSEFKRYIESHLRDRISTELKIQKINISDEEILKLIEKVERFKSKEISPDEGYCRKMYAEFESRFARLRSEFGIDYILPEIEKSGGCGYNVLNNIKIISGKIMPEDLEIEEDIKKEIDELKESMTLYQENLFLNMILDTTLKGDANETSRKHIAGLLAMLFKDGFVIGDDFIFFDKVGGEGIEIPMKYGGLGPVMTMLDENLMRNQIQSIIMALILVFLLMLYLTRSVVVALISMIPILFTLLVDFSIMAIFNIPVDDVTIVIASILIGVGIDYTIHTITGLRLGFEKFQEVKSAISFTIRVIGRAVFLNTSAVSLGFVALLFGDFLPLRTMGILTAVTMFVAATSAIVLIPAFVMSYKRFNIKEVKL